MGIISTLISLPMAAPMKGSLWIAHKIHEAAADQHNNPAMIRSELSRLEAELLAGKISEEAYDEAEMELLKRLQAIPR